METWAVIKTGGKQYKVEEGSTLALDKISSNGQENIFFNEVLLVKTASGLVIGKPQVDKAKVKAKILENRKDKKIRVVKFKAKSRYMRIKGHRQPKTLVLIEKIQL